MEARNIKKKCIYNKLTKKYNFTIFSRWPNLEHWGIPFSKLYKSDTWILSHILMCMDQVLTRDAIKGLAMGIRVFYSEIQLASDATFHFHLCQDVYPHTAQTWY